MAEAIIAFPGIEWASSCVDCGTPYDEVGLNNFAFVTPWNNPSDPTNGNGAPLFDPATFEFPPTRVFGGCVMAFIYDTQWPYAEQSNGSNQYLDSSGYDPIPPPAIPGPGYCGYEALLFPDGSPGAPSPCAKGWGSGPTTRWWTVLAWMVGGRIHVALIHSGYVTTGTAPGTDYCLIAFYGSAPIGATCRQRFQIANEIPDYGLFPAPAALLTGVCQGDRWCAIGKGGSAVVSLTKCWEDEEI